MTKYQNLLDRFLTKPSDFTWGELVKVLNGFDYEPMSFGKTGGSRIRFIRADYPPIVLHKPHPKPTMKHYQLDGIIAFLKQENLL